MIQTGCGDNAEVQWHLTRESAGPPAVYSLRNRFSNLCLSGEGARVDNDVPVTQYLCGDRKGLFLDQFWTLRYRSAFHAWQLVNVNSGKCAGARSGARDHKPVLQQHCRDDPWLMWQARGEDTEPHGPIRCQCRCRCRCRAEFGYAAVVPGPTIAIVPRPCGFTYEQRPDNSVTITHQGRAAGTLRGARAEKFLAEVSSGDAQLVMARWTGAYKHGNERMARNHPRNRR